MSGSSQYDRNDARENKGGEKTPYENEDEEDAFDPKDANGDPPKGNQDQESKDQTSQHRGEEDDDTFKPDKGHHDSRAARALLLKSPDRVIPPQGQQGMTTPAFITPAPETSSYLGLADMLENGGPCITDKSKISAELKWQATISKDKEKIKKILKNVPQVRGFHAFLFMMKNSCFMQMVHSIAKFATINPTAEDVDGTIFAFIGDRLSNQEPQAILILTNAWTTWMTHKVGNNVKMMTEHYKDKQNYGSLYQEVGAKTNKHVPNILAILLSAVKLKGRCHMNALTSS